MDVADAKILWVPGFSWYELHMKADVPTGDAHDLFVFDEKPVRDGTYYFAETPGGWVRFYAHSPRDESGFGGHEFTLRMRDGSVRRVKGPWSSRSASMNALGFTPSMEVHCQSSVEKDHPLTYATHITIEAAERVLTEFCPDYHVVGPRREDPKDYVIEPVRPDVPREVVESNSMVFPL